MNRITQQAAKRQLITVLAAFVVMNAAALLFYGLLTHQAMQSATKKFVEIDNKRSYLNQISESLVVTENALDRLFEVNLTGKSNRALQAEVLQNFAAGTKLLTFYQTELVVSGREFAVLETLLQVIKKQQAEVANLEHMPLSQQTYLQRQQQLEMDLQQVRLGLRSLRLSLDDQSKQSAKLTEQNSADHFVIYWVLFFFLTVLLALSAYRLVWLRGFFLPAGLFLSYRQALDNYFGICQLDAKGNFTNVNKNFCRARSLSASKLIGQKYDAVVRTMNGEVWQQLKNNQAWYGVLEEPLCTKSTRVYRARC